MPVTTEAAEALGAFTLILRRPIRTVFSPVGGEERAEVITEVTLREPETKDLLVTDKADGDVAKTIALVAHLTGLTPKQVGRLHPADFTELGAKAGGF